MAAGFAKFLQTSSAEHESDGEDSGEVREPGRVRCEPERTAPGSMSLLVSRRREGRPAKPVAVNLVP